MAAFNKQFSALDPFNLPRRPEFFGWPFQIAHEACEMLRGRDLAWLTSVARQLETLIAEHSCAATLPADGPKQAQAINTTNILGFGRLTRDWYGDVHLFANAEMSHDWGKESVPTERWERYAALSLWKLVDAYIMLDCKPDPKSDLSVSTQELQRWTFSGGYAIEAMRALQTASLLKMEKDLRSQIASELAVLRHKKSRPSNEELLKLAYAKPFKRKAQAARYLADMIEKKDAKGRPNGKFFIPDTIEDWLTEAGWQANA